jgi:hypothetical protein
MPFIEQLFILALWIVGVVVGVALAFWLFCVIVTGLYNLPGRLRAYAQATKSRRRRAYTPADTRRRVGAIEAASGLSGAVGDVISTSTKGALARIEQLTGHYVAGLDRLRARGELTPSVEAEFQALTAQAAKQIAGMSRDFTRMLFLLMYLSLRNRMTLVLRRWTGRF